MRIPIAHISGGDITEGAIDNEVRNAVTMMSTLHFPGTQTSAARIFVMASDVGTPCLVIVATAAVHHPIK
jgi:UDP-N-acetylglucosamine 2-epimerase